jgi:hypothetical protein
MISVLFAHCNFNMSPIDSKKVSKNKKSGRMLSVVVAHLSSGLYLGAR